MPPFPLLPRRSPDLQAEEGAGQDQVLAARERVVDSGPECAEENGHRTWRGRVLAACEALGFHKGAGAYLARVARAGTIVPSSKAHLASAWSSSHLDISVPPVCTVVSVAP